MLEEKVQQIGFYPFNYYTALTSNDLQNPLGFRDLDGKGKYNSELYIPRFALAAYIAILSSSYPLSQGESLKDESTFLRELNSGISNLFHFSNLSNFSKKKQGLLNHGGINKLFEVFRRLNNTVKTGKKNIM